MPRHETSKFDLSYGWLRGEDWWGDPVSDNFTRTDMLLHPFVKSMSETAPPLGAAVGDMYIVPVGATDSWAGKEMQLAIFTGNGWVFCTPTKGVRIGCESPEGWYWYNGAEWVGEDQITPNPPAPLGTRYDILLSVTFQPEPLEVLAVVPILEPMRWPNGAPDSAGRILVNPRGIVHISVKRNSATDIGTISFSPSSQRAVFSVIGDKLLAKGDVISFHMPETVPDNFINFGATLRMLLMAGG